MQNIQAIRKWVKRGVAGLAVGGVGFVTDVSDLVLNAESFVTGKPYINLKYEENLSWVLDEYGSCFINKKPIEELKLESINFTAVFWRCRNNIYLMYFQGVRDRNIFQTFYLPPENIETTQPRSWLSSRAYAQGTDEFKLSQASSGRSDVKNLICRWRGSSGQFVIRLQLKDGTCIDQVIDKSGRVIQTKTGVSCSCPR